MREQLAKSPPILVPSAEANPLLRHWSPQLKGVLVSFRRELGRFDTAMVEVGGILLPEQ